MSRFRQLLADQRGNVAVITALMILPMLVLAGGATDIARYETFRAQLQDGVDRAVLASASLTQGMGVEATAAEYLKSVSFIKDVDLDYNYSVALNGKRVTITARYDMATGFLPLIGIRSMQVVAKASAEEHRKNLEISMMLDMSGSMLDGTPSRISLLRPAAKAFIDEMITADTAPYTSLSIVPYAGSVNPGATAFGILGTTRQHSYSSCIEFASNTDYAKGMVPFNLRAQVPHFTENHAGNPAGKEWGYCPYEATSITYLSNNATTLKARIDSIKLHDGTGTGVATNWGMLLLDPSARTFIGRMANAGAVPGQFASRPANFEDGETVKIIVLMTDGVISAQRRPNQYAFPRNPEGGPGNHTMQSPEDAAISLRAVCDYAKSKKVIVYTIGFDLSETPSGRADMSYCASSPGHFYDVEGLDIATAFESIARSIQRIKLTQ